MDYYHKYLKYKTKYLQQRNNLNRDKLEYFGGFYVLHTAQTIDNLINILKDGEIKLGKLVEKKRRQHSGPEPSDYVYGNINFDDLKNIVHLGGASLILHPDIVYKYGIIFNKGWFREPATDSIIINKTDSNTTKTKKLKKIKKYLENPTFYPKHLGPMGKLGHEILFDDSLPLENNLLGVVCAGCPKKDINIIKKLLKQKYPSVSFFNSVEPLPTLDELL